MALDGTYSGLQASVASWLKRTDLTTLIPDFVVLCEQRIATDLRIRAQVISATLTTVGGTQSVALPSDFLEAENVTLTRSIAQPMTYITPEQMDLEYPIGGPQGPPQTYSIVGQNMLLGPTPDQAYPIPLSYYQRFSPLAVTSTNWLLSNYPAIYLFGALAEAAPWMMEDERIPIWEGKYKDAADKLQTTDDRALRSGSALRVRVAP